MTNLYPYQLAGVEWLTSRNRALLADDMGLGKSAQLLVSLPESRKIGVLIICPSFLAPNWAAEIPKWRTDFNIEVVRTKAGWRLPEMGEIVICSYGRVGSLNGLTRPLRLAVLLDEAHYVKNPRTARTRAVKELTKRAHIVRAATGTPLFNKPLDLWNTLDAIQLARPTFGGFERFVRGFNGKRCGPSLRDWQWGLPQPWVKTLLKRHMLRRTKAEVLDELPPKVYQSISIEIDSKTKSEIDAVAAYWVDKNELPHGSQFASARSAIARARVPATMEILDELEDAGKRCVVFSAHIDPVMQVGARDGWGTIHGGISVDERFRMVERFQAGELRGIAGTIGSMGVGLTLTEADTVIFIDRSFNPSDNLQAEDRAHRIGQKKTLQVLTFTSDHPIDARIEQILDSKTAILRGAGLSA